MTGMVSAFRKVLFYLLLTINVVDIILLLVSGYSGYLSPRDHPLLALSGLLFPFFFAANAVMLLVWLLVRKRMMLLPIAAIILTIAPLRTYVPINLGAETPEGAIKVLSYNVYLYNGWTYRKKPHNPILDYVANSDADIICLQEASPHEHMERRVNTILKPLYPYSDSIMYEKNGDCLAIYSRFPIIDSERIPYPSAGNQSMASRLLIDGDTVLVVNNHLETVGFSVADKKEFNHIVEGKGKGGKEKGLLEKLKRAVAIRSTQADAVAKYIEEKGIEHVIVCGDFNDHPLSYTHRTIGRGLRDCFVASGNGFGYTYDRFGIHVRIDNILCSKTYEPYNCQVDRTVSASDHYPVFCWLKRRANP